MIAAPVIPVSPVYRLKLSLLTLLSLLPLPIDATISITAAPKEPLKDIYVAAYKEPFGSLRRRLKEPLKEQVNNNLKYRSKLKPKEEIPFRIQSLEPITP